MSAALNRSSTISEDQDYSKFFCSLSNLIQIPHRLRSMSLLPNVNPAVNAVDLSAMNTLGLACQAKRVTDIYNLSQLPALSELARQSAPVVVLGGGSNLVLPA